VEFDPQLKEKAEYPLTDYSTETDSSSHGIIAIVPLRDDAYAFLTDRGRLYRIPENKQGIEDLGRIHPSGKPCYCATLFTFDGKTSVCGLAQSPEAPEKRYDWFNFDLVTRKTMFVPAEVPLPVKPSSLLIYGCTTRDVRGHFYVAGRYMLGNQSVPGAWRIIP
jgi:hypothetical protein